MKDEIRKEIINLRNSIPNKKEISTIIVNKIKKLDVYKKSRVVAIYNSLENEVDTKEFLIDDKVFLLPRVVNNDLIFLQIDFKTKYTKSIFGVMEPLMNNNLFNNKIDLMIIPGVSFDKDLNRLGYGKGYYDRFLKNKDVYKIGVCFDLLLAKKIPIEDHDIKMDMVVTEKRIIKKEKV